MPTTSHRPSGEERKAYWSLPSATAFDFLMPVLRVTRLPDDVFVDSLLEALGGGEPRRVALALHVTYRAFGFFDGFRADPVDLQRLRDKVALLSAAPQPEVVRAALDRYRDPRP